MQLKYLPWKRIIIFSAELLFGINVVLVDIWIYSLSHPSPLPQTVHQIARIITPTSTPSPTVSPALTPMPTTAPVTSINNQPSTSVKEFFVPLGSGQTNATDWTDIPGALGYVDSTLYKGIKKVVLEATVTIPNGNETAWIRLFDKTDGHPVWFSETSWNGGDTQFIISQPITFDSGNKLYQIQIKNQLPVMAVVSNARIHITLQ